LSTHHRKCGFWGGEWEGQHTRPLKWMAPTPWWRELWEGNKKKRCRLARSAQPYSVRRKRIKTSKRRNHAGFNATKQQGGGEKRKGPVMTKDLCQTFGKRAPAYVHLGHSLTRVTGGGAINKGGGETRISVAAPPPEVHRENLTENIAKKKKPKRGDWGATALPKQA